MLSATIEINIEDVNDNNPKFKEPFYKFSVPENTKFGVIIGTILASDPDENKTISYAIDSVPELGNLIFLDADHGDIVVANKIDREENEWLNITVSKFKVKTFRNSHGNFCLYRLKPQMTVSHQDQVM